MGSAQDILTKKVLTPFLVLSLFMILAASPIMAATPDNALNNALKEDFKISTNDLQMCACATAESSLLIQNTGDITSRYLIETTGALADWATIPYNIVDIEPGSAKRIPYFVNGGCDARGSYNGGIKVTTALGNIKKVVPKISVKACTNIGMTSPTPALEACPAVPLAYEIDIANTGSFEETYKLSSSRFNNFLTFDKNVLTLKPFASKKVRAYLNLPAELYGNYSFSIFAKTKNTNLQAELPLETHILPCYDYEINITNQSVCNAETQNSTFYLRNNADIANTYALTVRSEDNNNHILLQNSTQTLLPHAAKQPIMLLDGTLLVPGTYNQTITSVSQRGNIELQKNFTLRVENCNSHSLKTESPLQLVACESAQQPLILTNSGTRARNFTLEISGTDYANITSHAFLEPNETLNTTINWDVPCNVTKNIHAVLSATNDVTSQQEQLSLDSRIISQEDAYAVEIFPVSTRISYNNDTPSITIKHLGSKESSYVLSLDAPAWASINTTAINLSPGEEKRVPLLTAPLNASEGKYAVTIFAENTNSGLVFARTFNLKLQEKSFIQSVSDVVRANWKWTVVLIVLVVLLAFLVLISMKIRKGKASIEKIKMLADKPLKLIIPHRRRFRFKNYLITLLIIAAVVLGVLWFSPHAEKPETSLSIDSSSLNFYGNTLYSESDITEIPILIRNIQNKTLTYSLSASSSNYQDDENMTNKFSLNPGERTEYVYRIDTSELNRTTSINLNVALNQDDGVNSYVEKLLLTIKHPPEKTPFVIGIISGLAILFVIFVIDISRRKIKRKIRKTKLSRLSRLNGRKKFFPWSVFVVTVVLFVALILIAPQVIKFPHIYNFDDALDEQFKLSTSPSDNVSITINLRNTLNSTVRYDVLGLESWMSVNKERLYLNPGDETALKLFLSPLSETLDGTYVFHILGQSDDAHPEVFTKSFEINLSAKTSQDYLLETLFNYLFFVVMGFFVLAVLILFFEMSRLKSKKDIIVENLKREVASHKRHKRVNLKLRKSR